MRTLPTRMIQLQQSPESDTVSNPATPPLPRAAVSAQEGFESLLGQNVLIFCANYIYAGKLIGVGDACVLLEDAAIVYETGAFNESGYKDAQRLPSKNWYVALSSIESYGIGK